MIRIAIFLLLLCQPALARSLCEGRDLIAALPAETRAVLHEDARDEPFGEGLLWQAEKGETRIILFGTYHLRHRRTAAHLEALAPRIDAADAVYLEVSANDQNEMERAIADDPSIMFITQGKTLPDLLGEPDWTAFADAMRARQIPPFIAAKFKPVWAATVLGISPCEIREGALEGKGIDMLIGDHAVARGIENRSLEDYRVLLQLLDSIPMEQQLDMIRLFFAWDTEADDLSHTLKSRYLAGDIAMILAFSRYVTEVNLGTEGAQDYALFEEMMLDRRNRAWVDLLVSETPGRSVFVAAGAGHLPGETGVLKLLQDRGFRITSLPFAP